MRKAASLRKILSGTVFSPRRLAASIFDSRPNCRQRSPGFDFFIA